MTMTPSSSWSAPFTAAAMADPEEMPAKMPTSVRRRAHRIDSRARTIVLRSSRSAPPLSVNTGGTKPSSRLRSPSTASPAGGSTAHSCTSGLRSFKKRPTPMRVPAVPSPATKCVTSGQSRQISGPVPS